MSKPKAPKEDPSTIRLRARQADELVRADEQENQRIKQMLATNRGGRFFRGAPSSRAAPSNTAGRAPGPSGPNQGGAGFGFIGPVRPRFPVRL